jgi:hypothetical protein
MNIGWRNSITGSILTSLSLAPREATSREFVGWCFLRNDG